MIMANEPGKKRTVKKGIEKTSVIPDGVPIPKDMEEWLEREEIKEKFKNGNLKNH